MGRIGPLAGKMHFLDSELFSYIIISRLLNSPRCNVHSTKHLRTNKDSNPKSLRLRSSRPPITSMQTPTPTTTI